MTRAGAGPRARRPGARRAARALVAAVVLAAVLGAAYGLGYRVNVQTGSVPVPKAATSPEDVVLAYVDAYDHRDFATMATIYPSGQGAYSRFRAMGTMRHPEVTQSRAVGTSEMEGMFPERGHSYYRVEVRYDFTGLTGSDLALDDGPGGSIYWLERSADSEPWTIRDEGF